MTMHPHHTRRQEECRLAAEAKSAAGLRVLAGRRLKEIAPPLVADDFSIREHSCGIRSIPEPTLRRDGNGRDCEFRVSIPFVAFQHKEFS
jgi:hypothetical protein